ncbi:MAG: peptide chain release factor N(5)-glutamine methyltransferase [Gammaproteobacteria bacterium]
MARLLADTTTRLDALNGEGRAEAETLLGHVLNTDRTGLFMLETSDLDADAHARFEALVQRRLRGEPVAYITGTRGFWTLDLAVSPATLIPRPETEQLVELALEYGPHGPAHVADLGTGSGAIALALASERPHWRIVATDVSQAALDVAAGNRDAHHLTTVTLVHGDWFEALPEGTRFDLMISNPPYIEEADPHLDQGDLPAEPRSALAAGPDGLDAIRRIAASARQWLLPGGWLMLEHGYDQGAAVRTILTDAGLVDAQTHPDLAARDRVTAAKAPR